MPEATGYVLAAYALAWGVLLVYGGGLVLRLRRARRRLAAEEVAQ